MTDTKIRIGLDIDGVLAAFHQDFIAACGGNPDDWKKWEQYPFEFCPVNRTKEEIEDVWQKLHFNKDFWLGIKPAHGSSITRVAEISHKLPIYFITHRPKSVFSVTAEWLVAQGIEPTGLLFVKDKRRVCSGLHISAYLDDFGEVVDEFDGYSMKAYLIDRPWNRDLKGYRRVTSVGEFLDKVLEE